jgi:hypothetical protein
MMTICHSSKPYAPRVFRGAFLFTPKILAMPYRIYFNDKLVHECDTPEECNEYYETQDKEWHEFRTRQWFPCNNLTTEHECKNEGELQHDSYGNATGYYCNPCYNAGGSKYKYRKDAYFDEGFAGERMDDNY